jgi:hypothetical protein
MEQMTDTQVKHMVERFLGWRLPESFNPDGGISFKKTFNDHMPQPMKNEPTGTNLFDFDQATAMVLYMIEGLPDTPLQKRPVAWRVKDFADGWVIFQDEQRAYHEAEHTGAVMQGLYVRDGTPG